LLFPAIDDGFSRHRITFSTAKISTFGQPVRGYHHHVYNKH
jgi:hypothetical protein